jgi:hypothetical protein
MKHLIDSYVDWIRDSIALREVGHGWHEIVTPFLNHKNDMIELYVRQYENEKIILSDGGNTINELKLSGLDIDKSKKRLDEFNTILRSFGLHRDEKKEISIVTDVKKFPEVKHRLIQAILSIDDMVMLSEPKVESFFIEDVAIFFELNDILFVKDTTFIGKSGFSHKFDFTLPKIKDRKEVAIRAINKPRKDIIGGVMWTIEDMRIVRPNTDGLVIINDEHGVNDEIHQALNEYNIPYIGWSNRKDELTKLRYA